MQVIHDFTSVFWLYFRNTISKVYPAIYIENATELAFDDITPEDLEKVFISLGNKLKNYNFIETKYDF